MKERKWDEFDGIYFKDGLADFGIGGAPSQGSLQSRFVYICYESFKLQMYENSISFFQ